MSKRKSDLASIDAHAASAKRGRGRPPSASGRAKSPAVAAPAIAAPSAPAGVVVHVLAAGGAPAVAANGGVVKRGRGRPPKVDAFGNRIQTKKLPILGPDGQRRGRGRPSKAVAAFLAAAVAAAAAAGNNGADEDGAIDVGTFAGAGAPAAASSSTPGAAEGESKRGRGRPKGTAGKKAPSPSPPPPAASRGVKPRGVGGSSGSASGVAHVTAPADAVQALRNRIALQVIAAVKKSTYNDKKRPVIEVSVPMDRGTASLLLGDIGTPMQDNKQVLQRLLPSTQEVMAWLPVAEGVVHPVKYNGKSLSVADAKTVMYGWVGFDAHAACQVTWRAEVLTLKCRMAFLGVGSPPSTRYFWDDAQKKYSSVVLSNSGK